MSELNVIIRAMFPADWPGVQEAYRDGIGTGNATFETELPDYAAWDKTHHHQLRFVAEGNQSVCGWAALSPVSSRPVYAGVMEVSIYIKNRYQGKGLGRRLLQRLVNESETTGVWTLQAGIFPENTASISLHKSLGFRIVGTREKIGRMDGRWRDVVLMERRSSKIR